MENYLTLDLLDDLYLSVINKKMLKIRNRDSFSLIDTKSDLKESLDKLGYTDEEILDYLSDNLDRILSSNREEMMAFYEFNLG